MKNLPKKFENDDFQANLQGEFKAKIQPKFELKFSEFKVPDDYKFHCFGKSREIYIQVDTDRFLQHTRTMFSASWEKLECKYIYEHPQNTPLKPLNLSTMLNIAAALSQDINFVRVDFYNLNGDIIVGELTFTPEGGTGYFRPHEWDKNLGDLWV